MGTEIFDIAMLFVHNMWYLYSKAWEGLWLWLWLNFHVDDLAILFFRWSCAAGQEIILAKSFSLFLWEFLRPKLLFMCSLSVEPYYEGYLSKSIWQSHFHYAEQMLNCRVTASNSTLGDAIKVQNCGGRALRKRQQFIRERYRKHKKCDSMRSTCQSRMEYALRVFGLF